MIPFRKSFVYVIGGKIDGFSERLDALSSKWATVTPHPCGVLLPYSIGVNVLDKYLYIFTIKAASLMIWCLDIDQSEVDI